jgi:4'-phosphopantetheinyl transferase
MEPGTCDVWWARTAWMRPWHAEVLSDVERARRTVLWDERHRTQYTVVAALLRLVAAPLTGQAAEGVVVDRSCPSCGRHHGRPRLPGTGPDVSISHSGATVAVAVSTAGAVGVDVQQVADDSVHDLSPLVLAESEARHVVVAHDFFIYWTRKEALVKATGDGSRCRVRGGGHPARDASRPAQLPRTRRAHRTAPRPQPRPWVRRRPGGAQPSARRHPRAVRGAAADGRVTVSGRPSAPARPRRGCPRPRPGPGRPAPRPPSPGR